MNRPRRLNLCPVLSVLLVVAATVAPSDANAQMIEGEDRPGLELRLFRPAVDSKGFFTLNASPILPHLDISFGLILDYSYGLLRLDDPFAVDRSLVQHSIWGTLHFNLGLLNWAVIGLQVPVGVNFGRPVGEGVGQWGGDVSRSALEDGWRSSMVGDVSLHSKFRLLRVERFPVGLAAVVQLQFMSGDAPGLLGDPGQYGLTAISTQLVLDQELGRRFRWAFNVGYRVVLGDGPDIQAPSGDIFSYDDQLTFGLGMSYNVIRNRLDLVSELYGATSIGSFFDWSAGGVPLELSLGLRIFVERNSYLYLGAATGVFSPGYSASAARVFAAWIFEPSIGDRDGDGIKDDVDQCPDDPEDLDDFMDVDGCPDPDNDRDTIPDVDDECPFIPEDHDNDEDEDGCPEGNSGDRDGDGIIDSLDQCPDDPEDIDQFEDEDGCPDPDNDQDGILDVDDLCPNEPEDVDGFEDDDGCPDPDNDRDRILDVDDGCPNRPEVYNGFEDDDGCPDEGPTTVTATGIIIMERVEFETDSAEILPRSFPILDAVAATLRGNPQITLIEIQGHADERSSDAYNLQLTGDRSASVLNYLASRGGVVRSRMRARGYGERCPREPGHNEAAWRENRRVEFTIIRTTAGETGVGIPCEDARDLTPRAR